MQYFSLMCQYDMINVIKLIIILFIAHKTEFNGKNDILIFSYTYNVNIDKS